MEQMTSQPCETRVAVASFSFAGSYQEFRKITWQVVEGSTLCAPSSMALPGPTMSGMGKPPMNPSFFDRVTCPAAIPARYVPS